MMCIYVFIISFLFPSIVHLVFFIILREIRCYNIHFAQQITANFYSSNR